MTNDTIDSPDFDDLAELIARGVVAEMSVAFVGRITRYDRATFTADVRPVVRGRRWDPIEQLLSSHLPPTIPSVRVAQHYTDQGGLVLPYRPGDYVWCEVADRSHDEWFARGGNDVEPRDLRRFNAADVVVTGPVRPANASVAQHATHADDPVLSGSVVHLGDANPLTEDWVALAGLVFAELDALRTYVAAHVHTVVGAVPAGPSPVVASAPTPAPAPINPVAATKVKAT